MKTICFFNSMKTWGGGEKWQLETALLMHGRGYKVLAIAHTNGELWHRLKKTAIDTIGLSIGNLSFLNLSKVGKLTAILRKNEVTCIVINLSRDLKIGGLSAKKAGVKRIVYGRGSAIPIKNSVLNRYYFKNIVTDVLANSKATKKTVLEKNTSLFPEDKIKVIYHGVEVSDFISQESKPLYTAAETSEIVLGTLGRLEYEKNHQFLVLLAEELKKRKLKFKILIGGTGSLLNDLKERAKKVDLSDSIHFLGFIKNPPAFIRSTDIFVLPSLWEGFGYVLAEAALCKKPIIAFDTTSIPELVKDGLSGYVVGINNVEKFADKVEYLAEHPKKRKEMGEKGFEFARENFDNKKIQEQLVNYLAHGR